ncbi:DUF6973 domain-containing protein [Streptomyces sp. NPDC054770]
MTAAGLRAGPAGPWCARPRAPGRLSPGPRPGSRSFNRTQRTSGVSTADCADTTSSITSSTTTTTTADHTYDSADRITDSGYTYDAFGRTTALPDGSALAYCTDDLVRQETTVTQRQSWSLDADHRLAAVTTATSSDNGGTWDFDGVEGPSTRAERDWCCWPSRWRVCTITASDAQAAKSEAIKIFGSIADRSFGDAFQHILWMALMAWDVGASMARGEGKRHEDFSQNTKCARHMALTNNDIGINIGLRMTNCHYSRRGGKFATKIIQLSMEAACDDAVILKVDSKQAKAGYKYVR